MSKTPPIKTVNGHTIFDYVLPKWWEFSARSDHKLLEACKQINRKVYMIYNNEEVDAKQFIPILLLGTKPLATITIKIEGIDSIALDSVTIIHDILSSKHR